MNHDLIIIAKGSPFIVIEIHPDDLAPIVRALLICAKHHYDSKCKALASEAFGNGSTNGLITILRHDVEFAQSQGDVSIKRTFYMHDFDILLKTIEMRGHMRIARMISEVDMGALQEFYHLSMGAIGMMQEWQEKAPIITRNEMNSMKDDIDANE